MNERGFAVLGRRREGGRGVERDAPPRSRSPGSRTAPASPRPSPAPRPCRSSRSWSARIDLQAGRRADRGARSSQRLAGGLARLTCPPAARRIPGPRSFCGGCGAPPCAVCPSLPGGRTRRTTASATSAAAARPPARQPRRHSASPGARYTPKHLAEKILTAAAARSRASASRSRCSSSTSRASRRCPSGCDPEEVHGCMNRAFELMLAEVHRYEGTVNQFLGDGIMALFGAPIAHEDHARRAVHAALGIARALEALPGRAARRAASRFQARAGAQHRRSWWWAASAATCAWTTPRSATRPTWPRACSRSASPARVRSPRRPTGSCAGYFETRSLGELPVKGKAEPVAAWEVVARARDAHAARGRGRARAHAVRRPRARAADAARGASSAPAAATGRWRSVVGEAGIGKSRLLLELRRADRRARPTGMEGHCLSFGRAMTFHPLVDLLQRQLRDRGATTATRAIAREDRARELPRSARTRRPRPRTSAPCCRVDPGDAEVRGDEPARSVAARPSRRCGGCSSAAPSGGRRSS